MSNPMLNDERWDKLRHLDQAPRRANNVMTMDGALNKTLILLGLLVTSLVVMWSFFWQGPLATNGAAMLPFIIGGGIGGFVLVMIAMFKPTSAPVTGPLYAICEGIFLGGLTIMLEPKYPGLPLTAAVITIGIALGCVGLYRAGIIRASNAFVKGVMGATVGVFIMLMGLWLLSMFGIGGGIRQSLYGSGPIGLGFSGFMILLATFNIIVDMRFIEDGAKNSSPKWMEWMGAMGLMVTIVWLYIEVLNLLIKLRGRD